jgi:hypothetical protein
MIVYLLLGVQAFFLPSIVYSENSSVAPQQEAKFYESLRNEIKKSYTDLLKMKEEQGDHAAFEDAKVALEVKLILFRNFYHSAAIQREDVRDSLLKLFAQNQISMEDLQDLKSLVTD